MKVIDKETGSDFWLDRTEALEADLERHADSECSHTNIEIRKVLVSGGAVQFRKQCQSCGELINQAVKKALAPPDCLLENVALRESQRAKRNLEYDNIIQRHIQTQKSQQSEWRSQYEQYLQTPEWKSIRAKVLARAQGTCEGCGRTRATQVHHLTYEHVFKEFLFELVAVCDDCHGRLHDENEVGTGEWEDSFPCAACRFQDERGPRRWCGILNILAVDALAEGGGCGPGRIAFEPLR